VRDDRVAAAIFLIPTFVGFFIFYVYPALRGLWYSFTDFNLIGDAHYVGLDNYAKAIGDKEVWNAFAVTIAYALYNIIGQTFLGLLLAALMQRFARSTWVRSLLLLPWLVPNVAIALIWGWLLDSNIGYVTRLLSYVGIDGVTFYNAHAAMPIVAGINIWAYTGYTALLLYAGMLQIPGELYESAALDGAGEGRMFFSITLPLLRPVLVLVLVMGLIGSFQIFDTVQIGYAGHPIPAVRVIYYYIYQQGFTFLKMGYASAVAMLLVVVLAIFTAIQLRLMRAGSSDLA
jgi:sugar ABC transporter, permease protein